MYTFALTDQSHIARHCAKYAVVMGASSQFLTLFHPKQALHWSQTNALFTQHLKKPGLGCITLPIRPGTNQWKLLYTDRDTLKRFLLIFLNSTNLLNILNTDREPFSFIVLRSRQFGLFVCICVWLCFSSLSTTTDYPTSLTWWCCHLYFNKLLSSHSHPLRFTVTFASGFTFAFSEPFWKPARGRSFHRSVPSRALRSTICCARSRWTIFIHFPTIPCAIHQLSSFFIAFRIF